MTVSATETVAFTVRLPRSYHTALEKLADRELSSLNREVNIAVRAHLDAAKRKAAR